MNRGSIFTGAALSLAMAGAIATAPPAHGAVAYSDGAAWLSAAAGLGPVMLVPVTLQDPVFTDAWGSFTDLNTKVDVPAGPPPGGGVAWNEGGERPRSVFLAGHGAPPWSWPSGGLFALGPSPVAATFGCYPAVYPCLGVQTFAAAFAGPVLGFGGSFEWFPGYGEYAPVPLTVNGVSLSSVVQPSVWSGQIHSGQIHQGFIGFIGPMDTLSIHWLGGNADNYAWVHWAAPFAIVALAVPEPHSLALFASVVFALVAAGAVRARPTPRRP